ncbi:uncharacterized protein LOC144437277 [Glandiceps talaboti]
MDNSTGSAIVTSVCTVLIALYVFYDKIRKDALEKSLREQKEKNDKDRQELEEKLVVLEQDFKKQIQEIAKDRDDLKERLDSVEKKIEERFRFGKKSAFDLSSPRALEEEPYYHDEYEQFSPIASRRKLSISARKAADLLEWMRDANPLFIGRDDIIDKIHQSYEKNKPEGDSIDPTKRKTVIHVINGLAGCGKSEIAIQYVKKYFNLYASGILWILAGSTDTLDYAFQQTYKKLKQFETNVDFGTDYRKKAIIDWLEEKSDWLLVLDNADDAECIYDYFPKFPDGGHIIITSRDRNFKSSLYPTIKAPFDVQPLKYEDAEMLLVKSYFEEAGEDVISRDEANQKLQAMKEEDPEEYDALSWLAGPDGLDGLPLALNTATRYMKENNRCFVEYKEYSQSCLTPLLFPESEDDPLKAWLRDIGLVQYATKLRKKTQNSLTAFLKLKEEDLHWENDGMDADEITKFMEARSHDININKWMYCRKGVLATWKLTFRKIIDKTHGAAAMELLQLCACLTPTVSENIIIKGAEFITLEKLKKELQANVNNYPSLHHQHLQIQRNLDDILQCLRRYTLVEGLPKPQKKARSRHTFSIHRVVRKAVKIEIDDKQIIEVISCASKLLNNLITDCKEIHRNFTRRSKPLSELQEEIVMHVKCLSRNLRKKWLESAKDKIKDSIPLLNAAALYFECFKSRPEEAQALYAKAFECTAILTTQEDPQSSARKLGNAQCLIGRNLLELGKTEDALAHLKTAKEHYSKLCSEEEKNSDIDIAKYHYILARAKQLNHKMHGESLSEDETKEIEEDIKTAINISKEYYTKAGEEYGELTAIGIHELALFRLQLRTQDLDLTTIEQLMKDSLDIKRHIWDSEDDGDHISIATGMTDLARLYLLMKDSTKYEEVEALLVKALAMKERVLPQFQEFESWQLGVYYLIRLYMLLGREDDERQRRERLQKVDTKISFEELFKENDDRAFPPDVSLWSRSILLICAE